MSGNGFKAGAVSAGLNEALQKELGKISDPLLHQAVSALVGETAAKITGAATQVGAAVAFYASYARASAGFYSNAHDAFNRYVLHGEESVHYGTSFFCKDKGGERRTEIIFLLVQTQRTI